MTTVPLATPPDVAIGSLLIATLIGALVGLLVGMFFSFLLGSLDKRVFDLEAVNYGGDVHVIGAVGKSKLIWSS